MTIFDRQTDRQSNFELFRIILMVLIVAHHYVVHGGFAYTSAFTFNKLFLQVFGAGGKLAVNAFVLMSGYFLIRERFRFSKLCKLILQIWFYSILILMFAWCLDLKTVNTVNVIKSLMPFGLMNWFAYTYLGLFIFFPLINRMLLGLDRINYLRMLILGFIVLFLLPTLTTFNVMSSGIIMFLYLYALGAYIRIYSGYIGEEDVQQKLLFICCILIGLFIVTDILGIYFRTFVKKLHYFSCSGYGIFPLLMAMLSFLWTKNISVTSNKLINTLAMTTFGIYLIHDNGLIRRYLWHSLFQNAKYYTSELLVLHGVMSVLIVFCGCAIVDYLRVKLIEEPFFCKYERTIENWGMCMDRKINKWLSVKK